MYFSNNTRSQGSPLVRLFFSHLHSPARKHVSNKLITLLLLSFLLVSTHSSAEERDEIVEADTLENHGLALYQKELYDEAVRAFRQLLKIRPNQKVYFNIGQCEFMRKRFDLALEAFTIYLAGDPENIAEKRREYTERVVEEISPLVGRFEIQGDSPLEVWIDDELRGNIPVDGPIFVLEGEHRLEFKKNSEIVQTETYAVNSGQIITIQAPKVTPEPTQQNELVSEPTPKTTEESVNRNVKTSRKEKSMEMPLTPTKSPLTSLGIVITSLGGISLAVGIVTGSLALSKDKELADKCPDKDELCPESNETLANRALSLGMVTNVLLPIGAVAVTSGVILAIVGHKKNSRQKESMNAALWRIAPYGDRSKAGLFIEGRF